MKLAFEYEIWGCIYISISLSEQLDAIITFIFLLELKKEERNRRAATKETQLNSLWYRPFNLLGKTGVLVHLILSVLLLLELDFGSLFGPALRF